MATLRTQPTVGLGDPSVLRRTESQLAQSAIIANGKSTVSNGEAIFVGTTLSVNTNNVTLTTSANNQPADIVTVYSSQGTTYVSAIDQTVKQTVINQIGVDEIVAGNGITISSTSAGGTGAVTINTTAGNIAVVNLDGNVSNVLRGNGSWGADANSAYGNSNVVSLLGTFGSNTIVTTGNITGGNIIGNGQALTAIAGGNVSGAVGLATSATTANSVAVANVSGIGNIATINLDGNVSNVLRGNGSWGADANSSYGDSNVVSLLGAFGSNTIVTTGNITGTYANGNSNVNIATANGNVTIAAVGNTTMTVTGTGANIIGTANISGNANIGNIGTGVITLTNGAVIKDNAGNAVAFGKNAGSNTQGNFTVAIGTSAGENTQGVEAVAIGVYAGSNTQGNSAVAIGAYAGYTNQANNSIILNATGANLNQTVANTFTVAPVRNDVANIGQVLFYNTTSKEVTYGNTISVAGNITGGNVITAGVVKSGAFVTGNIPAAATAGAGSRAFVTDATLATFGSPYVGGAANAVPVYSDGSAWFIG